MLIAHNVSAAAARRTFKKSTGGALTAAHCSIQLDFYREKASTKKW